MARIRFSLRLLIILVSALALFLGYSQHRRREILRVCAELKKDGADFTIDDRWLWVSKPDTAEVRAIEWPDRITLGDRVVSSDNLRRECKELEKRLYEFSVTWVSLWSEIHLDNGEVVDEILCFEE